MTVLHASGMLLIVATVLITLAALAGLVGLAGTLWSRKPGANSFFHRRTLLRLPEKG